MAEARAAVAAVIGADVGDDRARPTRRPTAMNAAIWSIDWRPGDRVVTTQAEHPGGLGPGPRASAASGVELVIVDVGDGGDDDGDPGRLRRRDRRPDAARRRSPTSCGRPAPGCRSRAIARARPRARRARGRRRRAGRRRDPGRRSRRSGADFYAVAGQKWLLGPEGTGALWRPPGDRRPAARRAIAGWFTLRAVDSPAEAVLWPRRPPVRGRRASTGRRSSGMARSSSAGCRCTSGLPGSTTRGQATGPRRRRPAGRRSRASSVLTPRDRMATLVTFRIAGWPPRRGARRAGRAGSSRSPGRSRPRRDPDQRRVLHDRRRRSSGSPTAVELLAAPHAGDAAGARA